MFFGRLLAVHQGVVQLFFQGFWLTLLALLPFAVHAVRWQQGQHGLVLSLLPLPCCLSVSGWNSELPLPCCFNVLGWRSGVF